MQENYKSIIAANIKKLRNKRGWSQGDLAKKLNIQRPTISKWENEQSEPASSQLADLANIFSVSTEVILGKTDKATQKIVVVDTSIFIKRPLAIDDMLKIFDEVLIPDIVISELNHLKDKKQDKLKQQAWLAMATIEKYKNNPKLVLKNTDPNITGSNDKKIAQVATDRSKESIRDKVYMYSDDVYFPYLIEETANLESIRPEQYSEKFEDSIENFDSFKTTTFFSHIKNKNLKSLKHMDIDNVDVNKCDASIGFTPLIQAIRNRSYVMVDYLIKNVPSVDFNKRDKHKYNFTPLLHACQLKDIKMIEMLLKAGADPNIGSAGKNFGNTPLMVSAWHGFKEGVTRLAEEDISFNQQDFNGFTALHKACIKRNYPIAKILIKHTDIKIRDHKNKTADKHLTKSDSTSKNILKLFVDIRAES
ncbi:MAG: ankyrin repeat domain-containing protein [bacterium]